MKIRKTPRGFRRIYCDHGRIVYSCTHLDVHIVHQDVKQALVSQLRFLAPLESIKRHMIHNNKFYWKIDLRKAFDHVTFDSISRYQDIPYEIFHSPSLFFHDQGGLIQGAPASPYIFQWHCQKSIDIHLQEFCQNNEILFTRYADDILFSSRLRIGKGAREHIRKILRQHGFSVNEKKTELVDIYSHPIVFLGVSLFRNRASPTHEFLQTLQNVATLNTYQQEGKESWHKAILALNH